MFFEEESKDTHGSMDDYDLNFEQGESVSWDKLLDENNSEDELPEQFVLDEETEADSADSIADSLLDMDDASFESFIEEQKQNIVSNKQGTDEEENIDTDEALEQEFSEEENFEDAVNQAIREDLAGNENFANEAEPEIELMPQNIPSNTDIPKAAQRVPAESGNISDDDDFVEDASYESYSVEDSQAGYRAQNTKKMSQGTNHAEEVYTESDLSFNPDAARMPAKKSSSTMLVALVILLLGACVFGLKIYLFTDGNNILGAISSIPAIQKEQPLIPNADDTGLLMPAVETENASEKPSITLQEVGSANLPKDIATASSKDMVQTKGVNTPADQDIKKVNLKIVDSGRQNPFVPVGNVNNLGFIVSPKIDITEPFTTLGEPDPQLERLMKIIVSGILYDNSSNPSAVVNVSGTDYFVQKGDKIDTFTVIGITKDKVVIKEKNNIFSATIGQSFSNSGIITGQTQIINTNHNQVYRQYTTSDDININVRE